MSKMSNLKKGVVGVCAATMLTGLCAVPAFAADQTVDTTIKLDTSAVEQITVTVPTGTVTGVVDNAGTMTFADNYDFTNGSLLGIKITNVEVQKDAGATAINLVDASTFSGDSAGDNAVNITAKIGDMEAIDISGATFTATGGAAIENAPTISTAAPTNVALAGKMKNFTSAGVSADLVLAKLVWTVSVA